MATLKLIPGQRVNLRIDGVEQVQGNFGPQYAFKGATPDDQNATLYLNVDTADRQLARLGRDTSSIVGQTIEVARTEKNGTKYTDFNWPGTAPLQPAPRSTPQPSSRPVSTQGKEPYSAGPVIPGIDVPQLDDLFNVYDVCLGHAQTAARAIPNATPETVASIAATLFIQAAKR